MREKVKKSKKNRALTMKKRYKKGCREKPVYQ